MRNTLTTTYTKALAQQVREKRLAATTEAKQRERDALPDMKRKLGQIQLLATWALEMPRCKVVWGHLSDAQDHLKTAIADIEQEENHE